MSELALFVLGVLVTLVVAAAVGMLLVGAVLDGRDEAEQRRRLDAPLELLPGERELHIVDAA